MDGGVKALIFTLLLSPQYLTLFFFFLEWVRPYTLFCTQHEHTKTIARNNFLLLPTPFLAACTLVVRAALLTEH